MMSEEKEEQLLKVRLENGKKIPRNDLRRLPSSVWTARDEWFVNLLVVPTRTRHESGWARISIYGVEEIDGHAYATRLLALPDDLTWPQTPYEMQRRGIHNNRPYAAWHTDAYWPSGILRLWGNGVEFSVDGPFSSVEILIRRRPAEAS